MEEIQKLKERIEFLEECCKENSKFQNKILEIGARVGYFRRGETICLYKAIDAIEKKLNSDRPETFDVLTQYKGAGSGGKSCKMLPTSVKRKTKV